MGLLIFKHLPGYFRVPIRVTGLFFTLRTHNSQHSNRLSGREP